MTDLALATSTTELFDAICAKHGGELSIVDREVVAGMCKLFAAMRAASAEEVPKYIDGISRLESMLPQVAGSKVTTIKDYADEAAARKAADKLIAEKTGKGYVEKS